MPATARISVPVKQTSLKTELEVAPKTPPSVSRPKERAVRRRRARRRGEEATDSEEELVREPRSDSEEGTTASSEIGSEGSDIESEDEEEHNHEPRGGAARPAMQSESEPPLPVGASTSTSFPKLQDWSDAVAEESRNGAAPLPVVDFADMASYEQPPSPAVNPVPSPPPSDTDGPSSSKGNNFRGRGWVRRKGGESARQAYLDKLNNDPAYVPTVGQFWSHDDRLLDKDLRSLSSWWRGRWQGRGRGMRGRGGFGPRGRSGFAGNGEHAVDQKNFVPVERAWSHDGFEELSKEEEEGAPSQPFSWYNRGSSHRGRGGRGGYGRGRGFFGRGGFGSVRSASPQGSLPQTAAESHTSVASDKLRFGDGTRPWFSMKPERVWTKQSETYLFLDPQLKPMYHQGLGQGVRVKLPPSTVQGKKEPVVVRLPTRPLSMRKTSFSLKYSFVPNSIAVKLPTKITAAQEMESFKEEDVVTVQPPPMDYSVSGSVPSRPLTSPKQIAIPPAATSQPFASVSPINDAVNVHRDQTNLAPVSAPVVNGNLETWHQVPQQIQPAEQPTILPQPQMQVHAQMHSVAPSFQPSPSYGSPYAYPPSSVALPPGIGMLENGMTYEIATGRAVYLQTPPPPGPPSMQMPMYNPRSVSMHHTSHGSVHFVPQHASSMSMSASPPAFMPTPLFSLPRQSGRVEIKAPGEEKRNEKDSSHSSNATQVHPILSANVNVEPFAPINRVNTGQSMDYYDPQQHQQMYSHGTQYYYPIRTPNGTATFGYGQQYVGGESNPYAPDAYGHDSYNPSSSNYY